MKAIWTLLAFVLLAACGPVTEVEQKAPAGEPASPKPIVRKVSGDDVLVMVIPSGTAADDYPLLAKEVCGAREFCNLSAWTTDARAPRGFPYTDAEVETQAYHYALNRSTGFDQSLWNCKLTPRPADQCM